MVIERGICERVGHQAQDEHHGTECKDVDVCPLVRLASDDLWGHVHLSSQLGRVEASLFGSSQPHSVAQIDQLDLERLGQHDVLGLDVSVGDARRVQLAQCVSHLQEHVAQILLLLLSLRLVEEVDQLDAGDDLHDEVAHVLVVAISFLPYTIWLEFDIFRDLGKLAGLHDINFLLGDLD